MSDDFIPLNQSTPVQRQWNQDRNQNQSGFQKDGNHFQGGRRPHKQWNRNNNFSRNNSSFSSDNSFADNGHKQNRQSIDAYLHPSMLEDPWASLRRKMINDK